MECWSLQCADKMCCCTLRKRPETWCFARLSLGQKTPGPLLRCAGSIQAARPEISTIRRWARSPQVYHANNCGMIDRNQGTWTEMTKWKLMRVHLNRSVPLRWLRSTSNRPERGLDIPVNLSCEVFHGGNLFDRLAGSQDILPCTQKYPLELDRPQPLRCPAQGR